MNPVGVTTKPHPRCLRCGFAFVAYFSHFEVLTVLGPEKHGDFSVSATRFSNLLFTLISEFKEISEHPPLLEYPEDDDQGYHHEQENHHPGPA